MGPRFAQDLAHAEVTVGMAEQELEQLKLPARECRLGTLVADHAALAIQQQAMEVPAPLVPELEPFLVALHLGFDDPDVRLCCFLGDRRQLGYVALDLIE